MAVEVDYHPGSSSSNGETLTSTETIIVVVFVIAIVGPLIAGVIYAFWGGRSASRPARGQAVPSVEVHVPPPAQFRMETYNPLRN